MFSSFDHWHLPSPYAKFYVDEADEITFSFRSRGSDGQSRLRHTGYHDSVCVGYWDKKGKYSFNTLSAIATRWIVTEVPVTEEILDDARYFASGNAAHLKLHKLTVWV